MNAGRLLHALRQSEAEQDRDFGLQIQLESTRGLRIIGIGFLAVVGFMAASTRLFLPTIFWAARLTVGVAVIPICVLCIILGRRARPGIWARTVGIVSVTLLSLILMNVSLLRTAADPSASRNITGQAAISLMIALVALPLQPLQALGLGAWLTAAYLGSIAWHGILPDWFVLISLLLISGLGTALAYVNYTRNWKLHLAHSSQLDASRELSRAEIRRFVAQSAATTSRMAATLSHELNTPVGALKSSIDTLSALASRRQTAAPEQMERIAALEEQVRQSARDAASRLQQVVQRMQRVTNLDRAEVLSVDLNTLLKDVVYLLESESRLRGREVQLKLSDLPAITCKPQQVSAIFSNVLGSAVEGRSTEPVEVVTRTKGREVEVRFVGIGSQLDASETQAIFDPGFAERSGRIRAANWSLFMARQILRENGGEMRMESSSVVLTFPVQDK
ncbi:MAG TPA: HAMP domain-containing sensor histidine kinase [Bryobacteraceae bacterium]|nr:HAMP domain-containing sensor histidine kinase [Bryobacteraceae bacterium]